MSSMLDNAAQYIDSEDCDVNSEASDTEMDLEEFVSEAIRREEIDREVLELELEEQELMRAKVGAEEAKVLNEQLENDSKNHPTMSNDAISTSSRQLSAKLHCLYGVSIDSVRKDTTGSSRYSLRSDTSPIHPYARSLVYDLRQHEDSTMWGPFLADGSQHIDWEKMEALMIILDHNVKLSPETHYIPETMIRAPNQPFVGASPKSFVSPASSIPMEPALPIELQDPYNITGTWIRLVCFLDYSDLYRFNFENDVQADNEPRPPIDIEEAIRLITMTLRVTKIEPPGEDDGQALPIVHFEGKAASIRPQFDHNTNSKTRGSVRLTRHGDVRWTTFTIFHGEERWRSESIQVGGVQSARGVIGFWFDKNYDEHGPAGPTSFWKIRDGIEEETRPRPHSPMTRFTIPMY
ncbi:hypothetical protein ACLMJK_003898 [Lecanora helva]